jgi:hypothetical protein
MHPFTLIEGDGSQNDNYNKDATRVVPDQVSSLRGSTGRNDGEKKVEQNQQNCPTGKSFPIYGILVSIPRIKNISLYQKKKSDYIRRIPSRLRGAYHDRHERGTGSGGRW